MVFFTSDLHFGHENIIKHCSRPYSGLDEMTSALIEGWNRKVKPDDTVYIAGDLFFERLGEPVRILSQLSGKKHLIIGNHDIRWLKRIDASEYFESVSRYCEISESERKIVLCHYPMLEWSGSRHGSLLVFGHVHNVSRGTDYDIMSSRPNMLNAGVDINGYEPVNLRELIVNNAVWKTDNIVKRAEMTASLLYSGKKDSTGAPYTDHLRYLASQVSTDNEKAIAWLQNIINDFGISKKLLRRAFSDDIAEAVWTLAQESGDTALNGDCKTYESDIS